MLREALKQEIDQLSDGQLARIAEFITLVKRQPQDASPQASLWQHTTPQERAQNFRAWVEQLPKTGVSLPDSAFDRDSIYE
jgi:hypothetical protein